MEHNTTSKGNSGHNVNIENPSAPGDKLAGMQAAHHFAKRTELVLLMRDHVSDHGLLSRLCLVSRSFNAIFSQRLYRELSLNTRFIQPSVLAWIAGNGRFAHTKILSIGKTGINPDEFPGYDPDDIPSAGPTDLPPRPYRITRILPEWICVLVQRTATDILRNSPALHTIILDSDEIGSDKAVLILNNSLNGRFQQSTTKLQSLTLKLNRMPSREVSPAIFKGQNLKSLYMTAIPVNSWRVDVLCQILKESPGLRYLTLSYRNAAGEPWGLEQVCTKYHELGGIPLGLETMVLGWGIYLELPKEALSSVTGVDRTAKASYLSLLTDPACMRQMTILATTDIAWGTFDTSFFPNMDRFFLYSRTQFEHSVLGFFAMPKGRDFLRQVHLQVVGDLFRTLSRRGDITRMLFVPQIVNGPTSSLSPMGFSFRPTNWYGYRTGTPLLLPTTRLLGISIHSGQLVDFADVGLSQMSALECLTLDVDVKSPFGWSAKMNEEREKALNRAAENCPNLRYIRIYIDISPVERPDLSGSWEILREQRQGSHFGAVYPIFKPLDAQTDRLLRPQSMWTEEERKDQFLMKEIEDEMVYYKPLWME